MRCSWRRLRIAVRRLAAHFLAFELLREFAFKTFLFSRFHIEGVFLDFLDDAFLLNLSLKAPKRALNGLTFKHSNLGQKLPQKKCDRMVSMMVLRAAKQH